MSVVLGLNCKLFRGAAGAKATTEMRNVKDVSFNLESGTADITTRKADGWRMSVATLKEGSLEFGMLYDPEDADLTAIQAAYFANTPLAFFVSDGQGNGLDADFAITTFNIEQNLEEGVNVSVTAKPTNIGGANARAPQWVAAGV